MAKKLQAKFASIVKQHREAMGFSQADIAEFLNMSQAQVAKIENGTSTPGFYRGILLMRLLQIPLNRLSAKDINSFLLNEE